MNSSPRLSLKHTSSVFVWAMSGFVQFSPCTRLKITLHQAGSESIHHLSEIQCLAWAMYRTASAAQSETCKPATSGFVAPAKYWGGKVILESVLEPSFFRTFVRIKPFSRRRVPVPGPTLEVHILLPARLYLQTHRWNNFFMLITCSILKLRLGLHRL